MTGCYPRTDADCDDLIRLFNGLFLPSENTVLVRGGEEPLYLPADDHHPHHRIIFARGYFSSALHEIAHWLVAGPERRLKVDYGYWYIPDGRTAEQQRAFEQVEVKPQALEWILAEAAGWRFRISSDNLSGEAGDPEGFRRAVREQVLSFLAAGLNRRGERLVRALCSHWQRPLPQAEDFLLENI